MDLTNDTITNGRLLREAAYAAQAEWLETVELTDDDRAMLFKSEAAVDEPFEYIAEAVDAVHVAYQLEADQSGMVMDKEYSYYNVRHEVAHRKLDDSKAWLDGYAHVHAYKQHRKAVALGKAHAKKRKDRQYHDIAEIVLGKDGTLLGSTKAQRDHKTALADAFKTATAGLKASQCTKVRRYMATNAVSVQDAIDALLAKGKL